MHSTCFVLTSTSRQYCRQSAPSMLLQRSTVLRCIVLSMIHVIILIIARSVHITLSCTRLLGRIAQSHCLQCIPPDGLSLLRCTPFMHALYGHMGIGCMDVMGAGCAIMYDPTERGVSARDVVQSVGFWESRNPWIFCFGPRIAIYMYQNTVHS